MIDLAVCALGGALGSLLRYAGGRIVARYTSRSYLATLAINLTGAMLLGLLFGLGLQLRLPQMYLFAATGVLGGYTTYSTFMVQSVLMAQERKLPLVAGYLLLTCGGGLLLCWAGYLCGVLLT
ncbi:fluoride efflux transporter FluC [Paenibacillus sp. SYP-B4298]|uniref:fluoride efflux transporter FluC n=1 Tax=Paenibacillus sp. SYP-B4298 TaxID=2996034 RepID=UPI0022DE90BC|nr:CrcB family protein [Paenibacillus sp. SYP-B4298]